MIVLLLYYYVSSTIVRLASKSLLIMHMHEQYFSNQCRSVFAYIQAEKLRAQPETTP
jgi:hypothetical protein